MKFDAVIFDLYGTLVDSPDSSRPAQAAYDAVSARIAEFVGAPIEPFVQRWNSTIGPRMTGVYPDLESYIETLCREIGVAPRAEGMEDAVRIRLDMFRTLLVPRPGCLDTLVALRSMGHRIGLITDCSWETPALWPKTALAQHFDATTFSCAVGTQKPDPRIYNVTCEKLGVAPVRCLYVGDGGSGELPGAEAVGMTALRIHVPYETPPDHRDPWIGPEVSSLAQVLDWVA